MPKNEDGEFELILGNRQLLSVFFIVVILLGVFFVMGYIVGRNSSPVAAEVASARREATPVVVDSPAATSAPVTSPPPASEPARTEPVRTEPARTEPARPEPAQPEPARAETKREPPPAKKEKAQAKEPARRVEPANSAPAAGRSYLQLAATSKREADVMIDLLGQKGFKAIAAEISEKPGTFRVLVGPLAADATDKTRTDLQSAGFQGKAAIRRVF